MILPKVNPSTDPFITEVVSPKFEPVLAKKQSFTARIDSINQSGLIEIIFNSTVNDLNLSSLNSSAMEI